MENIDLVKLKELARAVLPSALPEPWEEDRSYSEAEISCLEFVKAVNPAVVLALIEQLEAVQRERDNAKSSRDLHVKASNGLNERLIAAEAELARRDAVAGEPVSTKLVNSSVLPKFIGDTDEVESWSCFIHGNTPPRKTMEEAYADAKEVCGPLYTAAHPASLPPEIYKIANHVAGAKGALPEEWQAWAEEIESDLRALGCQPVPVVKLPDIERITIPPALALSGNDSVLFMQQYQHYVKEALDAAGVRYETE